MSVLQIALLFLGLFLLVPGNDGAVISFDMSVANYDNSITVSVDGRDNQTCLRGESPCGTLGFPLENLKNSTKITVLAGVHNLSKAADVVWIENFTLEGASTNVTVQCEPRAGLSFRKSRNLLIQRIVFEGCGSLQESTIGNAWKNFSKAKFLSGLFLAEGSNLRVHNCTFRSSPGIAVNLYDVGGWVEFLGSRFVRNSPTDERNSSSDVVRAGGGVYVEFTPQSYEAPSGNYFPVQGSTYSFSDCHFVNNTAPKPRFEKFEKVNSFEDSHCPFGRGGGISVFLRGTTRGITVTIDSCIFQGNNASWGGGVFYELHHQAQNNSLNIRNATFEKNWVELGGGGARVGSITLQGSQVLAANKIAFDDCRFIENRAIFGGGMSYYGPTYLPENNDDKREIHFANCTWNGNEATAGSALGLNVWLESQIRVHPLVPFYVNLTKCSVYNNKIIRTEDFVVNGFGALYTNAAHLIFDDGIIFENNNNMTALLLDNAFLHVHGKTTFRRNSGEFGGAMALYGASRIITWSGSELLFDNNTASMGGAIYVRAPGPPMAPFRTRELAIHECFLAFENLTHNEIEHWKTRITFKDNRASGGAGNSVYATTLQSCYKHNETRENNDALDWPSVVSFSGSNSTSEISTDPVNITVIQKEWQDLSPSQLFDPSIHLIDERGQDARGTVEIETQQLEDCDVDLDVPSSLFIIEKPGTIKGLRFIGERNCSFMIQLKTPPGPQFLKPAPFRVKLREKCNPGFQIDTDNYRRCKCMSKLKHRGISRCGEDKKSVYLKRGYWFGKVGKVYDTYPCPTHYCNQTFAINESTLCHGENQTDDFLYDENTICAGNRKGVLCGSCKENYTVRLGDENCILTEDQSEMWLLYGGLFFICTPMVLLIILRIPYLDIFVSHLNAILFSLQMIDILKIQRDTLDSGIGGVSKLVHWQAPAKGFHLFNGLTDFNKFGINYIFPFYVLVLLLIFFCIANNCQQCYFAENIFPAFCALIVLCYTNVTDITFWIFQYVQVGEDHVLFSDGDVGTHSWNWDHVLLTVIASVFLAFVILPVPAILFFGSGRISQEKCRFLYNICDTFSHCYRTGCEGFAAFYFICRIILIIFSTYLPLGEFIPLRRAILEVATVVMAGTVLVVMPYHEDFSLLNRTDAVLLVNLLMITIFSTSLLSMPTKEFGCEGWWIVDILCWIPVAVLLFLIYVHRLTLLQRLQELKTWICNLCHNASGCCIDEDRDGNLIADARGEPTSTSGNEISDLA